MSRRPRAALLVAAIVAVLAAACSDDDGPDDAPPADEAVDVVSNDARCLDAPVGNEPALGLLDGAVAAIEREYGPDPALYELSIDQQRVSMVVAVDGDAEQSFWCGDAGYAPPENLGEAEGATFRPDDVDIDAGTVFDGVRNELDDPQIVELVAVGNPDGSVRLGLSVQSAAGGVLFVEVSPSGDVLTVQAL